MGTYQHRLATAHDHLAEAQAIAKEADALLAACAARIAEWHDNPRNFYAAEPPSLRMMREAVEASGVRSEVIAEAQIQQAHERR